MLGLEPNHSSRCRASSRYKPIGVLLFIKTLVGKYIIFQTSTAPPCSNFSSKTRSIQASASSGCRKDSLELTGKRKGRYHRNAEFLCRSWQVSLAGWIIWRSEESGAGEAARVPLPGPEMAPTRAN